LDAKEVELINDMSELAYRHRTKRREYRGGNGNNEEVEKGGDPIWEFEKLLRISKTKGK